MKKKDISKERFRQDAVFQAEFPTSHLLSIVHNLPLKLECSSCRLP